MLQRVMAPSCFPSNMQEEHNNSAILFLQDARWAFFYLFNIFFFLSFTFFFLFFFSGLQQLVKLKVDLGALSVCVAEDGLRDRPMSVLSQSVMWSIMLLCTTSESVPKEVRRSARQQVSK